MRGHGRDEKALLLAGSKRRTFEIRYFLVENRRVSGHLDVMRDGIRQPQQVIGTTGAYAQTGLRMPPMLDVAFQELARCRSQKMGACHFWNGVDKSHRVLHLIAKAKCATGLVERRTPPESAA